ncbi:MAG: hypothetical protein V3T58_02515 [Candidatus Hydrothermarchaeales archaeon]
MTVIGGILKFFRILKDTIDILNLVPEKDKSVSFEFPELLESINQNEIDYGAIVTVTGIYSDFLPISRNITLDTKLEKISAPLMIDPLPCKPFSINDTYCSSLQDFNSEFAGDPNCIPLFFQHETKRPMIKYFSGTTVEIRGKIVSISESWKRFLDTDVLAGIKVDSIDIVGLEKNHFGVLPWKIVNSPDWPSYRVGEGHILGADFFWSSNYRIDKNKVMCINGGKMEVVHGERNEPYETIENLYLVNLLDENQLEGASQYLSAKFKPKKADVQWDMVRDPKSQTNWLKNQIGI